METGKFTPEVVFGQVGSRGRDGQVQTYMYMNISRSVKRPGVLCPDCTYVQRGLVAGGELNLVLCKDCHTENVLLAYERLNPLVAFYLEKYNTLPLQEQKILDDRLEYLRFQASREAWNRNHGKS